MPTPASGTITIFDINKEFNLGNNLNVYRGVKWYQPYSLISGNFPTANLGLADFYNKQATDPAPPSPPTPIVYGPGNYNLVVPLFRNSFTVKLYGGGGGGGGHGGDGGAGGNTVFSTAGSSIGQMIAYGGGGRGYATSRTAGSGGGAIGGTINKSGFAGIAGLTGSGYPSGGNSGGGAAGGIANFGAPAIFLYRYGRLSDNQVWGGLNGSNYGAGGGGVTIRGGKFAQDANGGGGGGYCERSYTPSQLPAGTVIPITVGDRGAAGPNSENNPNVGYGGYGAIVLSWT